MVNSKEFKKIEHKFCSQCTENEVCPVSCYIIMTDNERKTAEETEQLWASTCPKLNANKNL